MREKESDREGRGGEGEGDKGGEGDREYKRRHPVKGRMRVCLIFSPTSTVTFLSAFVQPSKSFPADVHFFNSFLFHMISHCSVLLSLCLLLFLSLLSPSFIVSEFRKALWEFGNIEAYLLV